MENMNSQTNEKASVKKVLKEVFGHDDFRDYQKEAVDTILNKQDLLTILPTGGGKSLCYQLPSLIMDGVTVVISPLIALMQDQVRALRSCGVNAAMINSSQESSTIQNIYTQLHNAEIKLLYIAPERLSTHGFIELLQSIKINFFVVDEAHCVSEWGHEFRSEYRNLHRLKQLFPSTNIAAFTATATKKVQDDIAKTLQLKEPAQLRGKTKRDNITILAKRRVSNGKEQLLEFLEEHKGLSGIVYAFSRKDVENIATFLKERGYRSDAYHAGLPSEVREAVYNDFMFEKLDIVVATIAFGMGIDKSNIRFVVHMSMPKTMENYYQEIGRAGRDGVDAKTLLLYSKSDESHRKALIDGLENTQYKELLYNKLNKMYHYCNSSECRHKSIANYFDDTLNKCENICDNCLRGEQEQVDITQDALKLLSCIYRCEQKFGLTHIIDVLRGSKAKKVLQFSHDKLSVYGIGTDKSKHEWSVVADRLFELNALEIGEHRAIKIKESGFLILQKKETLQIDAYRLQSQEKREYTQEKADLNNTIFQKLKALRLEISLEQNIPAYMIFSDKTLLEMKNKLPQTKEEMFAINGVGEMKFVKYGGSFLELLQTLKLESESETKALKKLSKTYEETLQLLEDGCSLDEVVDIRELQLSTILSHVDLLWKHQKISDTQRENLLKPLKESYPQDIKKWCENGLEIESIKILRQHLALYENLFLQ